jgi:hypothetical protein
LSRNARKIGRPANSRSEAVFGLGVEQRLADDAVAVRDLLRAGEERSSGAAHRP